MQSSFVRARWALRVGIVGLVVLAASMSVSACTPLKGAPPSSDQITQLFGLVNGARAANGLAPLTPCVPLALAADAHNRDMAVTGNFDHTGSGGSTPATRAALFGYVGTTIGENIAVGQQSAQEVFDSWMSSPGHRANILEPSFTQAGFATFNGWWTQVFGAGGVC